MNPDELLKLALTVITVTVTVAGIVHGFASTMKTSIALLNVSVEKLTSDVEAMNKKLDGAKLDVFQLRVQNLEDEIISLRKWRHSMGNALTPFFVKHNISIKDDDGDNIGT